MAQHGQTQFDTSFGALPDARRRGLEEEAAWIERCRRIWAARFDGLDRVAEELKRKERVRAVWADAAGLRTGRARWGAVQAGVSPRGCGDGVGMDGRDSWVLDQFDELLASLRAGTGTE